MINFEIQDITKVTLNSKVLVKKSLPNKTEHGDGAYVINLDECKSTGTFWIALYINSNTVKSFVSFGVEYISEEI